MQTDHEYIGELYDYFDAAFLKLFLKNGAICERDEFETKVKQIGMRCYSVEDWRKLIYWVQKSKVP